MPSLPCRDCGRLIQVPKGFDTAWHGDCLASIRLAWMEADAYEREQLRAIAAQITNRIATKITDRLQGTTHETL